MEQIESSCRARRRNEGGRGETDRAKGTQSDSVAAVDRGRSGSGPRARRGAACAVCDRRRLRACVLLTVHVGAQTSCVAVRVRAGANAAEVAAKGGIEAVVAVLRRHEGVADVAQAGCGALQQISCGGACSAVQRSSGVWCVCML